MEYFVYGLIIACLSWIICTFLDDDRAKKFPDTKPYQWGYFLGIAGILTWGLIAFQAFVMASETRGAEGYVVIGFVAILAAVMNVGFLIRNRWLAVVATALHLNVVVWFVNILYLSRRWEEMRGFSWVGFGGKLRASTEQQNKPADVTKVAKL